MLTAQVESSWPLLGTQHTAAGPLWKQPLYWGGSRFSEAETMILFLFLKPVPPLTSSLKTPQPGVAGGQCGLGISLTQTGSWQQLQGLSKEHTVHKF